MLAKQRATLSEAALWLAATVVTLQAMICFSYARIAAAEANMVLMNYSMPYPLHVFVGIGASSRQGILYCVIFASFVTLAAAWVATKATARRRDILATAGPLASVVAILSGPATVVWLATGYGGEAVDPVIVVRTLTHGQFGVEALFAYGATAVLALSFGAYLADAALKAKARFA